MVMPRTLFHTDRVVPEGLDDWILRRVCVEIKVYVRCS
jgi:hypothetical protein